MDRATKNKSGLFLRRDISVSGVEFVPESIAITEDGHRVLLDQDISLQIVTHNMIRATKEPRIFMHNIIFGICHTKYSLNESNWQILSAGSRRDTLYFMISL